MELSGIWVGGRDRYADAVAGPLPLQKRKEEMGGEEKEKTKWQRVISTKTLASLRMGQTKSRHNNCKTQSLGLIMLTLFLRYCM